MGDDSTHKPEGVGMPIDLGLGGDAGEANQAAHRAMRDYARQDSEMSVVNARRTDEMLAGNASAHDAGVYGRFGVRDAPVEGDRAEGFRRSGQLQELDRRVVQLESKLKVAQLAQQAQESLERGRQVSGSRRAAVNEYKISYHYKNGPVTQIRVMRAYTASDALAQFKVECGDAGVSLVEPNG
jgi:hypothetical protein